MLIAIQFGVLIIVSIIALIRVFSGNAGRQAISPQLSWLWPSGLDVLIDRGRDHPLHLHLLGLGRVPGRRRGDEGTRASTPGIAAVITTLILVCTYVLVAYAVQSFSGFSEVGIGLNNAMNTDDVLTVLGEPVAGTDRGVPAAAHGVGLGAVIDADDHPAHRARHAVDGGVRGHPQAVRQCPSALHDPGVRHHRDGAVGAVLLPTADVPLRERTRRFGGVAGIGGGVLLRHHRIRVRVVLPQDVVPIGAKPVLPRHLPADRRARDGSGVRHERQGHDRSRTTATPRSDRSVGCSCSASACSCWASR